MKFVPAQARALARNQRILLRLQLDVAEAHGFTLVFALPAEDADHGMPVQKAVQVQEPAALGEDGHAPRVRRAHRPQHGMVGGQFFRVQFGVAAAEVQAVGIRGRGGVLQRGEIGEPRAHLFKQLQFLRIIEAERRVLGDGDVQFGELRQSGRLVFERGRGCREQ